MGFILRDSLAEIENKFVKLNEFMLTTQSRESKVEAYLQQLHVDRPNHVNTSRAPS